MAFTSLAVVRTHLLAGGTPALTVEDVPVTLEGTNPALLPHRHPVPNSERVKWSPQIVPDCEGPLLLSGYDWTALAQGHLVPRSLVVTPGEGLSTIYIEEADYQVNPLEGWIRRTPGGAIPDQRAVYVYSRRYTLFAGEEYTLDCDAGTLARRENGAIPDGATVLVDYTVAAGSVEDELIVQAIGEAHDRIVRALATQYSGESADQGLQTGETELVLAILARDQAGEALDRRVGSDAASRAREWQNLAGLYETRAWQTLRPFLDPYALHGPEKRSHE